MDTTPTRGGQALHQYLAEKKMTVPAFCDAHGFFRQQVQRLITGERGTNITAKLALAIERATDGRVPVTLWDDEISEKAAS